MDVAAATRVIRLFEDRGQLDRIQGGEDAARACLVRARERLKAAQVLAEAELWEPAFTAAYDAYRTSADAVVLSLGYRVPAVQGGHRIPTDIAHAAMQADTDVFSAAGAERFRQGRHESEYFDPTRPINKTAGDATWALDLATRAVEAVDAALSAS